MKIGSRNLKFVTYYQSTIQKNRRYIAAATYRHRSCFCLYIEGEGCDVDYVGRYKDQKSSSYSNYDFIDTIFIYNPSSCRNKIFLYPKVQSSLTVSDKKCCGY